jgi:drug/metabolite transporter (DMT)-like permease
VESRSSQGVVTGLFLVAVVIGSANFVAVTFSNAELPPFWGAGLRFGLAGIIFVLATLVLRLRWPRGRVLALTAAYGLFTFTLSYALMYWALTQMSAGMGAVILATVPLVTPLLAASQRLERLNRRALIGGLVAFGAILWMTVGVEGLSIPFAAVVASLVAAISVGESVILAKRISANHPAVNNAVGMAFGAPMLLVISLVAGETWVVPTRSDTIVAVGYLVVLGSVGLFVLTLLVVRLWTASASAYMFVLFPVGAMLFDAWLHGVPLTLRGVSGAVVVMASVWFGAMSPGARSDARPTPALTPADSG